MLTTTQRARSLQTNSTDAERLLWQHLRKRQLYGFKFRRQYPVGPYIADFASTEGRLIIELDDSQHAKQHDYDQVRNRYLQAQGFRVLRYWNNQLFSNMEDVLTEICRYLHSPP